MNDEKKSGLDQVPGSDNFSFEDYVAGKSTFPSFWHRVYLDQAAGSELADLIDEYEADVQMIRSLREKQRLLMESGTMSMGDDQLSDIAEEIDTFERNVADLEPQMDALKQKIWSTAMILHFRSSTPDKFGKVLRKADKEYSKANGKFDETDVEHITGRTRMLLLHQLAAYCIGWETPAEKERSDKLEKEAEERGEKFVRPLRPVPSQEGFGSLLDALISSELMRLLTAMNKKLDASAEWASRIDAGFPGGGPDLGAEPVGHSGAEDGEVVGSSAS